MRLEDRKATATKCMPTVVESAWRCEGRGACDVSGGAGAVVLECTCFHTPLAVCLPLVEPAVPDIWGNATISKRISLGHYRRPMPRVLRGVLGVWAFSSERGTPVRLSPCPCHSWNQQSPISGVTRPFSGTTQRRRPDSGSSSLQPFEWMHGVPYLSLK